MSSSNDIRIILWMFLVIIKGAVVRGQTGGPNAVALIDGQAMLDCAVNTLQISSWTRTTDGTSDLLVIASACTVTGNISAHYRTELLAGDTICRLTIGSVTMQQAGVYTCFDGLSTTYRSLITVIDPVANVVVHNQSAEVVEGDQLNISCSINYNGPGYPAPSLHPLPYWTTSPEQIYTSATYNTSTNAVTLVANVIVQKSAVPVFQCNTVFSVTGNTSGYNATAPADNFTVGSTKELDVQYSPLISNISSEGRNDSTSSCEISTVTCHATANPTANYTWIDIDEPNKIIHNQSYACAEFGRNYNCSATNIIRTKPYTDVKMHEVRDEYSTRPPCKGCRMSTMNITGETCTDRICSCLLGCNMTVTCIADAYPEPTYEWMQNGLVIPNSLRTLDNALDGTYTCVAKNVIDGCEFEARIDVEVVNCSSFTITLIVLFVWLGCCTLAVLITTLVFGGFKHIMDCCFPFLCDKLESSKCLNVLWIFLFFLTSCVASGIIMAFVVCLCFKDKGETKSDTGSAASTKHSTKSLVSFAICNILFVTVAVLWIVAGVGMSPCI